MFNKMLQDKALQEGKSPGVGCFTKRPLLKSPNSTPIKRAKWSVGSLAPPATRGWNSRLAEEKTTKKK
ncbi:UNVERIFIED_CONTAM: hypothetical protein Sradi_4833000 [Sesamum radiatum]|uniref:Uncharacterized protein n=1 Tax=Sesamum radiatum TaxID=300843 RepID=A0AAW2MYL4_SESRA